MLNPAGPRAASAPARTSSSSRNGTPHHPAAVGRRARGHHPGLGHDDRRGPRLRGRAVDDSSRSDLYIAEEMFVCGTAAEVSAGELGRRPGDPVPGPDDDGDRRRSTPRPSAARSTSTRTGSSMSEPERATGSRRGRDLRHHACATGASSRASRSPSRTSSASPSSSTGSASHWIEGGWPGANPKDEEFFRRAATELKLTTATLVAFGSTRRAAGQGRRRPDRCAIWSTRARRHGVHRRQDMGLPRDRGAADDARRRRRHGR